MDEVPDCHFVLSLSSSESAYQPLGFRIVTILFIKSSWQKNWYLEVTVSLMTAGNGPSEGGKGVSGQWQWWRVIEGWWRDGTVGWSNHQQLAGLPRSEFSVTGGMVQRWLPLALLHLQSILERSLWPYDLILSPCDWYITIIYRVPDAAGQCHVGIV